MSIVVNYNRDNILANNDDDDDMMRSSNKHFKLYISYECVLRSIQHVNFCFPCQNHNIVGKIAVEHIKLKKKKKKWFCLRIGRNKRNVKITRGHLSNTQMTMVKWQIFHINTYAKTINKKVINQTNVDTNIEEKKISKHKATMRKFQHSVELPQLRGNQKQRRMMYAKIAKQKWYVNYAALSLGTKARE